jgi:N-carbamoylputrescine amidase
VTNGVYVATTNRVGCERDVTFWGASFVAAPDGQLLARAAHEAEAVVLASCDLTAVATMRQHWPFLRDRRVDVYGSLTARFLDHGR